MFTKTYVRPTLVALCATTLSLAAVRAAEGEEENVKLKSVPEKAATSIEKHAAGGKITNVSKEKDDGKVVYEATINTKGKISEVTVDAEGTLQSIEEVISITQVPEAARKVIDGESAGGKVEKLERITKGKEITFEALISAKGKREEIVVNSKGKIVERETKKKHED